MPRLLILLLLTGLFTRAHAQSTTRLTVSDGAAGDLPAQAAVPATYDVAEQMPAFPGGDQAFGEFLRRKIQYPAAALTHEVSGKVYVRFIVDEQGHIRDARVVKGLGYGLDEEALRLVRIMPWWQPGLIGGQPVRVALTLPIQFRALP
ncbi:energy transducer TonB [Hymenobacter sp. BT175]|uniref:energy transducer TonB n=1 Tax=Hymenobacter translucens TaxID=2886507 RepID=UPI001D0F3D6A|nr:energy transducer TonB [Hymenobacter translucens]MCC2544839.1 energy transducer TonB [Hymenobacter translucens]